MQLNTGQRSHMGRYTLEDELQPCSHSSPKPRSFGGNVSSDDPTHWFRQAQALLRVSKLFVFCWILWNDWSVVGVGKAHAEIVDVPIQGKRGWEAEPYSESQRETTIWRQISSRIAIIRSLLSLNPWYESFNCARKITNCSSTETFMLCCLTVIINAMNLISSFNLLECKNPPF